MVTGHFEYGIPPLTSCSLPRPSNLHLYQIERPRIESLFRRSHNLKPLLARWTRIWKRLLADAFHVCGSFFVIVLLRLKLRFINWYLSSQAMTRHLYLNSRVLIEYTAIWLMRRYTGPTAIMLTVEHISDPAWHAMFCPIRTNASWLRAIIAYGTHTHWRTYIYIRTAQHSTSMRSAAPVLNK